MAVYVDGLVDYSAIAETNGKGWRYGASCHLIADSITELMEFAVYRLGLKAQWFQPKSSPHFDLTRGRRIKAVQCGAIELDRNGFVAKVQELRERRKNGENC